MARISRVVAPGYPHHVTQRGNRRQQTFFPRQGFRGVISDDDYRAYLDLMTEWCRRQGVTVWAHCLMPNHVHLIAVPLSQDGLRRAIGEAHRRHTLCVNRREGWRGHLWQGRFASVVLDEAHLLAAVRYVERNPVRAGLVASAGKWPRSSASAPVTSPSPQSGEPHRRLASPRLPERAGVGLFPACTCRLGHGGAGRAALGR